MKTGLLCHGRHVLAKNWKFHQWGDKEKGLLGQVMKTILLASQENPEIIIFGTGASEKDGLKESEYTIKYMFEHFDDLYALPQFQGMDIEQLRAFMKLKSIPEKKSQNTYEEIKRALEIFSHHGIERAIWVSNPDHISRCMQLAHQVYCETNSKTLQNFFAAQSDIGYNGTPSITSKIVEMPHRGDDPSPDLSQYIGGYFRLAPEKKEEFVQLVEQFFKTI